MAGRPSTKVKEEVASTDGVIVDNKELLKAQKDNLKMVKMMEMMQKEMEALKSQLNSNPSVSQVQEKGLNGKKIKCVNLMHNPLNVSTEPDGRGRMYSFNDYGDFKMIKYDDLVDIVTSYPNTIEKGLMFITNKDAVEELGLEEDYKYIYSKEVLDELVYLRRASDVDLFIGMSKEMQDTTALEIAKLFNLNETMDYNYLKKIKDVTGIDIEEKAKDLKEFDVQL